MGSLVIGVQNQGVLSLAPYHFYLRLVTAAPCGEALPVTRGARCARGGALANTNNFIQFFRKWGLVVLRCASGGLGIVKLVVRVLDRCASGGLGIVKLDRCPSGGLGIVKLGRCASGGLDIVKLLVRVLVTRRGSFRKWRRLVVR